MSEESRTYEQFNSSPEDKQLNQIFIGLELPYFPIETLTPVLLFASSQSETTFASHSEHHHQNKMLNKKQRTIEHTTKASNEIDDDLDSKPSAANKREQSKSEIEPQLDLDAKPVAVNEIEQNKNETETQKETMNENTTSCLQVNGIEQSENETETQEETTNNNTPSYLLNGVIHILPNQIHFGPNSFNMVISTDGTVISTNVTQVQEGNNFTVDVVYQFVNGLPSHTFKFSYCPVQKFDGVDSDNIEKIYNFS